MAHVPVKNAREISLMKESCRIVAEVIALVGSRLAPGVRTRDLDAMAEEYIRSRGGEPAFKGYGHDRNNLFPGTLCISIDDEVVHGIPDGGKIEDGQVVSIDVGVKKNGFFGDGARTFPVGRISEEKGRLLRVTEEALLLGIARARAGNHLHDVSAAVQQHVEAAGFSIVRDLVGHGIGKNLHEDPAIPNYGQAGTGVVLKEGMALAIEPMVNAGTHRVTVGSDGWTVRTADGKPSAHFEHTIVVTTGEAEILTR
ncbi:MAG TPA: type I methionyl aminopeptidase [Bacteroidota bacterium]|nr:type I methionyl aminopeptidase [Bacteroidota bacterium]